MTRTTQPSKEAVRAFMEQRFQQRTAPPAPEAIRRALDWHIIKPQPQGNPCNHATSAT